MESAKNRGLFIVAAMVVTAIVFFGLFFYAVANYQTMNASWLGYLGVASVGIILFLGEVVPNIGRSSESSAPKPSFRTARPAQHESIADELAKLAKLRDEGTISEDEFQRLKQNLLKSV